MYVVTQLQDPWIVKIDCVQLENAFSMISRRDRVCIAVQRCGLVDIHTTANGVPRGPPGSRCSSSVAWQPAKHPSIKKLTG